MLLLFFGGGGGGGVLFVLKGNSIILKSVESVSVKTKK